MKSRILSLIILLGGSLTAQKSMNLLNVKSPSDFAKENETYLDSMQNDSESKQLDYGYVLDKDIMWSKITWEIIDMNEPLNQAFYHSTPGISGLKQESIFDVIKTALDKGTITEVYSDESFSTKADYQKALSKFKIRDTSDWVKEQIAQGKKIEESDIDNWEINTTNIKMMKLFGMWYIDKKLGEMRFRPLGIAFMGPDIKAVKAGIDDTRYYDLFWVWYDNARTVLSKHKIFSNKNSSADISFDDLINARRFSSVIYKARNMQGRSFEDVAPGDSEKQLEFSEDLRHSLQDVEQGLWSN